jgi:hypothetical protein
MFRAIDLVMTSRIAVRLLQTGFRFQGQYCLVPHRGT